MKESIKKSKVIGSLLGIFGFIALVAGATYAWLTWRSNNIIIAGSTECFDVVYYRKDLGTVENPAMLKFMTNYNRDNLNQVVENPQYAEVGLSLDSRCTNVSGLGKLYLTTNVSTDDILLTGGLYYTLVKVENSTETFIKDGPITTEGDILLQDNIFVSSTTGDTKYRVYIWINGPITTDQNYVGASYVGEIRAEVVSREGNTPPVYAADYITNLYTTDTNKIPATVNGITYSLASSVGLMRDQFGSSSSASNTGNLRYYGADPANYVWLGDTYTSDITFPGDVRAGTPDIVRQAGDKKLWRIIGVFNGRLKLVTADPISTTGLSWDTSANTTGGNSGWGINQWGPSDTYEGADLMRLLNPGYEGESVNNSLYWNKTSSGTVYTSSNNATTSNVSFANTGLTANERSLIDTATWYTGAYDQVSYADAHYTAERGNMGKICTQGTSECDDTVTRTNTWNGKVGLISASDYGYAANLLQCNQTLDIYSNCTSSNWLSIGRFEWTLSSRALSGFAYWVFDVDFGGGLGHDYARNDYAVRPAVFLKSGVSISEGNGSQSNPFVLG